MNCSIEQEITMRPVPIYRRHRHFRLIVFTNRLDLEHRTDTQLRNVLRVEEDSLRGGILAALQKSRKQQEEELRKVNEATAALKTHREMVQAKIQNANVLQARKVACIATVNSLFQVLLSSLHASLSAFVRIRS